MKSIKIFLAILFSIIAFNSYSSNVSKINYSPETEIIELVHNVDFENIFIKIQKVFSEVKGKIQKAFEKTHKKSLLIILSILLVLIGIICPIIIIGLGFMAPNALFWLTLLGSSCVISIIGGIVMILINSKAIRCIAVTVLNIFSIIIGVLLVQSGYF